MPSRAGGPIASSARAWLLAACAFGLAVILWDMLASPRYDGAFGANVDGGPTVWTITYVVPGRGAARAGLRVGDKFYWSHSVEYRKEIAGRPERMRVQRGASVFDVTETPVAVPFEVRDWLSNLNNLWSAFFATIVAWFGVGRRARMLSWLFLFWALAGTGLGPGGFVTPFPWLNEVAYLLVTPVNAMPLVLLVSLSSTFGRPIGPVRRALAWSSYAVAAIGIAAFGLLVELIFITPWFDRLWPLVNDRYGLVSATANLLAAACAFAALATVRGEERQRAAWLLFPLGAISVVGAIWSVGGAGGAYYGGGPETLGIVGNLAMLILLAVMSYAVLSRRLLDVEFAINRAAVFAVVSFIVIGIFVAFEWLFNVVFDRATHTESTIASLGIALLLGVSLSYIHHYVDKFVDRVMFRKRHEREKALRDFAHEAAFITDREVLLDDTVRDVRENAETDEIAILLLDPDGTYTPVRTTNGVCSSVGSNDRAILKLRAWHKPIDLHDLETTLMGTRVYPLMARGELLGVLICGEKRDHQGFAPDEDDALFTMARGVGSALGALRDPSRDSVADAIRELREMMHDQQQKLQLLFSALPTELLSPQQTIDWPRRQ